MSGLFPAKHSSDDPAHAVCAYCEQVFQVKPDYIRRGRTVVCCSLLCSRRRNVRKASAASHLQSQAGERNHNFRGWASKRPYVYVRRFRQANPEKFRVQRIVAAAIQRGELVRPSACSACGVACRPDGHHDDYALPLAVRWLCRKCHVAADRARLAARRASA